jgi:hypothetical protein
VSGRARGSGLIGDHPILTGHPGRARFIALLANAPDPLISAATLVESSIAIVATARKMVKLFWHLLVREQDYAHTLPTALTKKIRTIELEAGNPRDAPAATAHPLNREQR